MYLQTNQIQQTKKPISNQKEGKKSTPAPALDEILSQEIRKHYSVLAHEIILTSSYKKGVYSSGISVLDEDGTVLEPDIGSDFDELYRLRETICSQYGNSAHILSPVDCEACPW